MTGLVLAIALAAIGAVGSLLGVLADRTEFGAGLAAAVKGRPYEPEERG